jgi:hypothetical protein
VSFRLFELAKFPKDMPNDHANGHREIEEAAAMKHLKKLRGPVTIGILATVLFLASPAMTEESSIVCNRTVKVQVVALDQPWMWNRLGAAQPGGMIYALYGDVVKNDRDGSELPDPYNLSPDEREKKAKELAGNVRLRDDKRARPLVLRANKGDCLEITFWNLLNSEPKADTSYDPKLRPLVQKAQDRLAPLDLTRSSSPTRWAGIHAMGIELLGDIQSDASWVGENPNSLTNPRDKNPSGVVLPGQTLVYRWYAAEEGTFLIYSPADMESGQQANAGLFGAINVEPEGAEWYRSQITHDDLDQATLTEGDLNPQGGTQGGIEPKAQFRRLEPAIAEPTPGQMTPTAPTPEGYEKRVLVTREADKQSRADVLVNEKGQIYSAAQQPLIYYHAIYKAGSKRPYRENLPVLQMIHVRTLGDALYDQPLQPSQSNYVQQLLDLGSGIIPSELRSIFSNNLKTELSAGAQLTDQYHYSWLVTDKGSAYLVQAVKPGNQEYHLQIFKAELDLISSDLTAVITGPDAGRFSYSNNSPTFRTNPASPDRRQPYREFTIIYHQAFYATQAFVQWANANLNTVMLAGGDNFAINYGSAAIGPEIVANRLGVGPMGNTDAADLKFEEFFLSSWAVGDPAMVVDIPANTPNALVSDPDSHREINRLVPKDSAAGVIASQGHNPLPDKNIPPQSDDFAPLSGTRATKAFFPDDPSNVYHSYMDDHVKFRILHAGAGPAHVHHLHAHQWLHSPDSDDGHYLDSQLIIPGAAYTLEIAYGGSGNRNKTVGDSIFHCHFYPHFAQGMWALWRVHDVFEEGTVLDEHGIPVAGVNRALPDGEIQHGTPIPAIIPMPTLAMAPMPAKVELTDLTPWAPGKGQGRRVYVHPEREPGADGKPVYKNPGYPFFIPGVSGHRSPHPPLGFAWLEDPNTGEKITKDGKKIDLDGGLPRHLVLDGTIVKEYQTRWDFTKDFVKLDKQGQLQPGGGLDAFRLPEEGTLVEVAAMKTHATRTTPSFQPNGQPGNFILNGLPPTAGAPYADPSVTDFGNANIHKRRYQAAVIQLNVVLNKPGWHFPQQRMISLWQDVADTIGGKRAPQPLFFRSNTQDTIQFWHTNLVPNYYELDDFQVRTPTDIIGQHIHLVKFDVTASDGASNGYNYESGTFSPEEVRERIFAINQENGLYAFDPATGYVDKNAPQEKLVVKKVSDYYPPPGSNVTVQGGVPVVTPAGPSVFGKPPGGDDEWDGAQTTVELWAVDPLLNNEGVDRTLRTVFTHDHFSPSTHQQAGLYAGLVVEPEDSLWYLPDGTRMNTRLDGGPTSWHGYIVPENPKESYREFMLEFQDLQLAYSKQSRTKPSSEIFDPQNAPKASAAFDLSQAHSIPNLMINAFGNYAAALDSGTLPLGGLGPNQQVIPGFPTLFLGFGVPLSENAKVQVVNKGEEWIITEATGEKNGGTHYVVRAIPGIQNGQKVIVQMPVYTPDITPGWSDQQFALNAPSDDNNGSNGPPFPQLVSQIEMGTYSLNYRNEPVPYRLAEVDNVPPKQRDPALAFTSIPRINPNVNLNIQPDGKVPGYPAEPLVPNAQPDDPYTPLLEAYANDKVQVRTLVGAHTESHAFEIHGVKWLSEPTYKDSGYRNAQLMGLSEHFEMLFDLPSATFNHSDLNGMPPFADYFYSTSSDIVGLNNGLWGIMRAYGSPIKGVQPLPNNAQPASAGNVDLFEQGYQEAKKTGGPTRDFDVTAVTAAAALPNGKLVFNGRAPAAELSSGDALLFVRSSDLANGKLKEGAPIEPLILRAAAGEWIKVTLRNGFDSSSEVFKQTNFLPYGTPFNGVSLSQVPINTSSYVGLHPQLVGYDPVNANGLIVGFNPSDKLVAPGGPPQVFYWYAGEIRSDKTGKKIEDARPIEFGATNLVGADELIQPQFGMVGALIIEPEGSAWVEDIKARAAATVTKRDGTSFRDFVVVDQNMVDNSASADSSLNQITRGSTVGAINFRSEPFSVVRGYITNGPNENVQAPLGYAEAFSNQLLKDMLNRPPADPQTPVFVAPAGLPVRFRLLVPSTSTSNAIGAAPVFIVHGHNWQEEPYTDGSTKIGNNPLSEHFGAIEAGPNEKFDLLFNSAGGSYKVPGDYLYDTYQTGGNVGTWGLFRVTKEEVVIENVQLTEDSLSANGFIRSVTPNGNSPLPQQLKICAADASHVVIELGQVEVDAQGKWSFKGKTDLKKPATIQVTALTANGNNGATTSARIAP